MLDQALVRSDIEAFNLEASSVPIPDARTVTIPVVLIAGDGIGPEVTRSAKRVLSAACPSIEWIEADGGAAVMEKGVNTGLPAETLSAIENTGVVLKGPMATPFGRGGKSANATLRKMFELYGNVRPVKSFPGVTGPYANRTIDFIIVRENVEDLCAGIEHMQTPEVAQCLKLITRQGSEKIARLAFSLAKEEGRKRVICATKSNMMKLTEGLFQRSFDAVSEEFPALGAHHMVVDNCAHQMVLRPEEFDVIVTSNMNGDILSDLAAALVGGLGLAPSADIGHTMAIFEAVHGSAPEIAGQDKANPTALIMAGAMMMRHLGMPDVSARIETAMRMTYANARHLPPDVAQPGKSGSTAAFTDRVIEVLDSLPKYFSAPEHKPFTPSIRTSVNRSRPPLRRRFEGVDIFMEWHGSVEALAAKLRIAAKTSPFRLEMISNRGTVMWPEAATHADTVPHWRCRFGRTTKQETAELDIPHLLSVIGQRIRWMHVEKLESYNDIPAYSLAQGELAPQTV